jgi:hypothetical protein
MSSASRLGKKMAGRFGDTVLQGTITNIDNLEERSMVEVRLGDGSTHNVVAWVQADLLPGNEVCLAKIEGGDKKRYAIVAANAPAVGVDPEDRDPAPDVELWSDETFRPKNIPAFVGGVKLVRQAQNVAHLSFNTYTLMRIFLTFSVSPTIGQVTYWIYGYDTTDPHLTTPRLMLECGTSRISEDGKRWVSTFDMTAPGAEGAWLQDSDEAIFVLVMQRLTSEMRGADTGRIAYLRLNFGSIIDGETVDLSAAFRVDVEPDGEDLTVELTGVSDLRIDQFWIEPVAVMTVDAVVLSDYDHL